MKISFFGGAQEVTGACYLLETKNSKLLIDCGLFQGSRECEDKNYEKFPFDAAKIDAVVITHAHVDHTGRLPKLIKEGFGGKIYSTPATKDLAVLMLEDNLGLMERYLKRGENLLYDKKDLEKTFSFWEGAEYHQKFKVGDFYISLLDAGHILGSAMVEIVLDGKKIIATGDLGNPPTPLLKPTEEVADANILLIESTYGDRVHEDKAERKTKIERAIEDTVKRGGVLMVPAFSLERTQELLFELNDLVEHGRIPEIPIFLDSPLAIKATEVYKDYEHYYNKSARYIIDSGDAIFKFPGLKFTKTTDESKAINEVPAPKVVIAGSGMSTGGRILHHEVRYLSDPNSTLLLVGYQAAGSLGRRLQSGAKEVRIMGQDISVRARIENIQGYSAHPDREMLMDFVKKTSDTLGEVFVIQGEPQSAPFFVQRIKDYLGIDTVAPKYGDAFEL